MLNCILKSNNKAGKRATETASLAYDGTLLPADGSNVRKLKDKGKLKANLAVQSGQGKYLNGTNQYIPTTQKPTANGTLVQRVTYNGGSDKVLIGCRDATNRIMIGVNTAGKFGIGFGSLNYDTLFVNETFVNNMSYLLELKWTGNSYKFSINGILKLSGTVTPFTVPDRVFYIGAYNNQGVAERYKVGIYQMCAYYDVELSDTQIMQLFQYPEKIKEYNGGLVPDIGNEANCKLFLPLCESSGSSVIDVSKPYSDELTTNGGFSTDVAWTKGSGWTISGGSANFNGAAYSPLSQPESFVTGKAYLVTYTVKNRTLGNVRVFFSGGTNVPGTIRSANGTYSEILYALVGNNELVFNSDTTSTFAIDDVSVKEVTAFPVANFTTTVHTSAKQLPYGAQCLAWKRDALGVPLGMSGGIGFDNNVSVKPVVTAFRPKVGEDFAIEFIQQQDGVSVSLNGVNATGRCTIGFNTTYLTVYMGNTYTNAASNGLHHIALRYFSADKTINVWLDGVLVRNRVTVSSFVNPTSNFVLGAETATLFPLKYPLLNTKVYIGLQASKFDINKAWAKADKIINPPVVEAINYAALAYLETVKSVIDSACDGVNNNIQYMVVGDSTRDSYQVSHRYWYARKLAELNMSYFHNAQSGITAEDWVVGTIKNTTIQTTASLQIAIDNARGVGGSDTIIEYSLGINDANRNNDRTILKNNLKFGITELQRTLPNAKINLVTPIWSGTDMSTTNALLLGDLYNEISWELGLPLFNKERVLKSIFLDKSKRVKFFYDDTHENYFGAIRLMTYLLGGILSIRNKNKLSVNQHVYADTSAYTGNLASGMAVLNGLWNTTTGAFMALSTYRALETIPVIGNTLLKISHGGNIKFNCVKNSSGEVIARIDSGSYRDTTATTVLYEYIYLPPDAASIGITISSDGSSWDALSFPIEVSYITDSIALLGNAEIFNGIDLSGLS